MIAINPSRQAAEEDSYREDSDEELFERYCSERDERAFEVLVAKYTPMIISYCGAALPYLKEDITQETFMAVHKNRHGFNTSKGSFKNWIYQIARSKVIDHLRKSKGKKMLSLDAQEPDENSLDSLLEARQEREINTTDFGSLQPHVDILPHSQRENIILVYERGFSLRQSAEIRQKKIGTIKSSLSAGLKNLRGNTRAIQAA